jgi:integrase
MNAITLAVEGHEGAAGLSTRLHALRHFYASGLIVSGCDVVAAQAAMGHSTATTTLDMLTPVAHGRGPDPQRGPPSWRSWVPIGDRERQSGL